MLGPVVNDNESKGEVMAPTVAESLSMTADDTQHDHRHRHGHGHGHSHGHGHGHSHGDDVDWSAMAEHLEIDGELALPLVAAIVSELGGAIAGAHHIVDVGAGPGVITCALAAHAPDATVTAVDTAEPLLHRGAVRATTEGVGHRVGPLGGGPGARPPP
ncbi:MAG TPA: hypothetical protein DCR14_06575, partial [Acidimicrobiaceae bacterium]|nr:hypothetical protein [Acidimicrobiaceae bacterium]